MTVIFKKFIKINQVLFSVFVCLTFFLLLLESYKYTGFLSKHMGIDTKFVLIFTLTSAYFVASKKLTQLNFLVFKFNTILLPLCIVLYLIMQYLEASNFHNYFFSKYHFQPTAFLNIVFLSLGLYFISGFVGRKVLPEVRQFMVIPLIIIALIFTNGITDVLDLASFRDAYIFSHLKATYDNKMYQQLGIYYFYAKFVKANTPDNSKILVPPMQGPWYSSGNIGLDRYFLFPRDMTNGSFDRPMDLAGFDYVLITWGEWGEPYNEALAWPKISIKAEKIIYFDPVSKETKEVLGNYNPKLSRTNGVWGIIKIKQ